MGKKKNETTKEGFTWKVCDGGTMSEDEWHYVAEVIAQIIVDKMKQKQENKSNNS
jgi:hypothetical protein